MEIKIKLNGKNIVDHIEADLLLIEFEHSYEPTGPFGAKSIGEIVINTPAPATAHAIYRATGVWHRELPITPEQIAMSPAEVSPENRSYPTWGNALRINDQSKREYPLTLIVHDAKHLELVTQAEGIFSGKYPLGYVGTSPWPGSVTNQMTMDYTNAQNRELYDFLREQMEIGWVIYGLEAGLEEEGSGTAGSAPAMDNMLAMDNILAMVKDMREKCPEAKQFWVKKRKEELAPSWKRCLKEYGVCTIEYENPEEYGAWLDGLISEIEKAQPPVRFDSLDREWAEWTNLSVTLPAEEEDDRVLLVGDSISAGYGDMVQKLMPGWHVDRLNTSEGIHHPNFLRLLEIALGGYPYRMVHINNGIHLHGQTVEEYGRNLSGVFEGIRRISPEAGIIFATTTTLSRSLSGEELANFDVQHFSMGDRVPLAQKVEHGQYWITDEKASEIYRKLNEKAKEICVLQGIPVDDLYQLCVEENLQKSDGVHFQEEAYRRLAQKVAESLKNALAAGK